MNYWLELCKQLHDECDPPKDRLLPTRLISLKTNEVKLCLSSELKRSQEYVTLSHCWGKQNFETLLSNNIEEFQRNLPPQALSKTFREAIEIAFFLGFQYIWIDSLCIIQDDSEDWAREAALMSTVYSRFTL